jgi:hypothetical protein
MWEKVGVKAITKEKVLYGLNRSVLCAVKAKIYETFLFKLISVIWEPLYWINSDI